MKTDRRSRLKDVMKTASGHDVIARLLYSLGMDESLIEKTPLGYLRIGSLSRLSMGKLNEEAIDALLRLLNSLQEEGAEDGSGISRAWWKEAVFYQVYPRSFYDSNGDGIGDIKGITAKLDHIRSLGVDAIWCSPFYDSPNADNGYDIRDYRKIMKEFGTMEDVEELIDECHKRGMKIIIDLVMNHTSDEHEWFQRALNGEKPYEDYYIWSEKPNNWTSFFSGSAWKYFEQRKKYALHLFAEKQMDLNWDNPQVRKEMYDIANWWLDKGADGFRLDVVSFISKTEGLPDGDPTIGSLISFTGIEHYFHGPHLDEYLREFHRECLAPHDAYTVGECPGNGLKMSRMITGDDRNELSQLFSFDHIENPGKIRFDVYDFDLRKMIPEIVRWQTQYSDHCWPTVFFDNHDNPKMCSKIDRTDTHSVLINKLLVTMQMTLKGTPYIYQGNEIGMTDYPFTSIEEYRDIETLNFYQKLKEEGIEEKEILKRLFYGSRDHARIPMQWNSEENAGFTKGAPWIKVHPNYRTVNVESEEKEEGSVLRFYRKMIALRKENEALIYGSFTQLKTDRNIFAYERELDGKKYMVIMNLTDRERNYPFTVDQKMISSNYDSYSNRLRPFEANIFEVR